HAVEGRIADLRVRPLQDLEHQPHADRGQRQRHQIRALPARAERLHQEERAAGDHQRGQRRNRQKLRSVKVHYWITPPGGTSAGCEGGKGGISPGLGGSAGFAGASAAPTTFGISPSPTKICRLTASADTVCETAGSMSERNVLG